MPKKGGVRFSDSATGGTAATDPRQTLRNLLADTTDQQRLGTLKSLWDAQSATFLDKLVKEAAKDLAQETEAYCSSIGAISSDAHTTLRNHLALLALLARRDYTDAGSSSGSSRKPGKNKNKKGKGCGIDTPTMVFPGCIQQLLLILEAVERPVQQEGANTGSSSSASSSSSSSPAPMPCALKFHALHAFNRLHESFPRITTPFLHLVVDVACRELQVSTDASEAEENAAAYRSKVAETLNLIASTKPSKLIPSCHKILKAALQRIVNNVKQMEKVGAEAAAAHTPAPALTPLQRCTLDLVDLSGVLLRRMVLRLPRAYPSVRMLQPRTWPFGAEDDPIDDGNNDENKGGDDDDDNEDDEEDNESDAEDDEPTSRMSLPFYTTRLPMDPLRAGVQSLQSAFNSSSSSEESAQTFFNDLVDSVMKLYERVGVEKREVGQNGAQGGDGEEDEEDQLNVQPVFSSIVTDAGATILTFIPLIVALSNQQLTNASPSSSSTEAHSSHIDKLSSYLIDQLRELDLSTWDPSIPMLHTASHLLRALAGVFNYAYKDCEGIQDSAEVIYHDLLNWMSDAAAIFPRPTLLKLRRKVLESFLALLYTMDTTFEQRIGSAALFTDLFPLLANPLLPPHLIWILRNHPTIVRAKVIPKVVKGLLAAQTKKNQSPKTVQSMLQAMGEVACFSLAVKDEEQKEEEDCEHESKSQDNDVADSTSVVLKPGPATLPLLAPYIVQMLDTICATIEHAPSTTGQAACLALCRIVMAGYDMPEVQSFLPRILAAHHGLLSESLFVAEQERLGDAYDEDDQDLVSQLQYCSLDLLHVYFQDTNDPMVAADPISMGAPDPNAHVCRWKQDAFLDRLVEDVGNIDMLRAILLQCLSNTLKPIFFGEDEALRNSECHLIKEILMHPKVFDAVMQDSESTDEKASQNSCTQASTNATSSSPSTDSTTPPSSLTVPHLILTLLNGIILADEDGQEGRKYNYQLCLESLLAKICETRPAVRETIKHVLETPATAKLMTDVRKDASTWKIVQQWIK